MDNDAKLEAARAAFARLTPEAAPAGFAQRLSRRLEPKPARTWSFLERLTWKPAMVAAAAGAFALLLALSRHSPPKNTEGSMVEETTPALDSGRPGYDPAETLCATMRDCS
jgi:hypothetical protein